MMVRSVFFTFLGLLSIYSYGQTPQIKWWYDTGDMAFGQSAAKDVDGDGFLEIAFSTYRNDSMIYVLNGEDGSELWKYNTGGCNDVAPLIYDVDEDGDYEIILPSSCNPTTFCFDADSGFVQWSAPTRGSDSPPTIADIDNDGKLEILHGEFGGYVICLNAEDGSQNWEIAVDLNSWIQTAPAILDVDNDGQLDFVVANWNFGTDHRIWAFKGDDQSILWTDTFPNDYMYHGTAFGDIDLDGKAELTIGDYEGNLFAINAEDGSILWNYKIAGGNYIGAPTSLADLNSDGKLDVVFSDWYHMAALNDAGSLLWDFTFPTATSAFRGAAISEVSGDNTLDVIFGTGAGELYVLNGATGSVEMSIDLAAHHDSAIFEIDHAPIIADFDNNDTLDAFIVGGHAEYPNTFKNYGRGYMVSLGKGSGPDWKMFRRDHRRSACLCNDSLFISTKNITNNADVSVNVYPNPFSNYLTLSVLANEDSDFEMMIYDVTGKVLLNKTIEANAGVNRYNLNSHLSKMNPGIYLFNLNFGSEQKSIRVVKTN